MMRRLLLPRNEEDHMPPKEKPQLKDNEIALIHWWIATGATFDKKTKELEQPEKIKPILLALQKEVKKVLTGSATNTRWRKRMKKHCKN